MSDAKTIARKAAYQRRKAAHDTVDPAPAIAALIDWVAEAPATVISGYMPIRSEIDPLPAMTVLARYAEICVPVIDGPGLPLRFAQWTPSCALVEGPFGAMIPADLVFLTPDTVIAPLVAYDRSCARLGYGGGFYDRTLEGLKADGRKVRTAGFAYSAQEADELPLEPTDQRLDAIVTETAVLRRL